MKNGVEEFCDLLDEMKAEVLENKCAMSDVLLQGMATALRTLYRSKVPKTYSVEKASIELGISPRQLRRDASACGVTGRRDGHNSIHYSEDDILKISEYRYTK